MVALIIGLLMIAFGVFAVLPVNNPYFLQWGDYVLSFLKGGAPILAFLIGLISLFIGVADIKDRIEAKKEEAEAEADGEEAGKKE